MESDYYPPVNHMDFRMAKRAMARLLARLTGEVSDDILWKIFAQFAQ